jgi:hypothetical protein
VWFWALRGFGYGSGVILGGLAVVLGVVLRGFGHGSGVVLGLAQSSVLDHSLPQYCSNILHNINLE